MCLTAFPSNQLDKLVVSCPLYQSLFKSVEQSFRQTTSAIAKSSVMNIKELILSYATIPDVPPELLSQALTKLETFRVDGGLTAAQISAVFTRLSVVKENKLKTHDLRNNNLRSVPTEILVAGISGLEEVNLSWTWLTTEQITDIYYILEDLKLKTLNLVLKNLNQSVQFTS